MIIQWLHNGSVRISVAMLLLVGTLLYCEEHCTMAPYDPVLQKLVNLSAHELKKAFDTIAKFEQKTVPKWAITYPISAKLIHDFQLRTACEVGVAFGTHSEYLLCHTTVEKLYSIDPYRTYENAAHWPLKQIHFDLLFLKVKNKLAIFGDRSTLLRLSSDDAAHLFEHNSLDFIYIDGDHSYEQVKQDLQNWFDTIRPGGIIAGDDYDHPRHPGVKKAVDEFFALKQLAIQRHPNVPRYWWAHK